MLRKPCVQRRLQALTSCVMDGVQDLSVSGLVERAGGVTRHYTVAISTSTVSDTSLVRIQIRPLYPKPSWPNTNVFGQVLFSLTSLAPGSAAGASLCRVLFIPSRAPLPLPTLECAAPPHVVSLRTPCPSATKGFPNHPPARSQLELCLISSYRLGNVPKFSSRVTKYSGPHAV